MKFKPGRESSEWAKATRAEVAGFALLALGVFLVFFGPSAEAAASLLAGSYLLAQTVRGYAESRGRAKMPAPPAPPPATVKVHGGAV